MEVNSRNSQLFLSLFLSLVYPSRSFIVLLSSKLNSNFTSIGKGILSFELYNRVSSVTVK